MNLFVCLFVVVVHGLTSVYEYFYYLYTIWFIEYLPLV